MGYSWKQRGEGPWAIMLQDARGGEKGYRVRRCEVCPSAELKVMSKRPVSLGGSGHGKFSLPFAQAVNVSEKAKPRPPVHFSLLRLAALAALRSDRGCSGGATAQLLALPRLRSGAVQLRLRARSMSAYLSGPAGALQHSWRVSEATIRICGEGFPLSWVREACFFFLRQCCVVQVS